MTGTSIGKSAIFGRVAGTEARRWERSPSGDLDFFDLNRPGGC